MNPSSSRSATDDVRGGAVSLRRSLLLAACIALSASLVVAVTASNSDAVAASVGTPRAATDAEQRAILIAAVEQLQSAEWPQPVDANAEPRRFLLENATVAICAERVQDPRRCRELPPGPDNDSRRHDLIGHRQSSKLIDALRAFNLTRQPLDNQSVPGTVAADRERVAAMFESVDFWEKLQRTYPETDGILRVSRAVVSARGDRALLYVETHSKLSGIASQMELFELRQEQWKYVGGVGYGRRIID